MESARLKADIVDGLGAGDEDDEQEKKRPPTQEETGKYAMMKTGQVKH